MAETNYNAYRTCGLNIACISHKEVLEDIQNAIENNLKTFYVTLNVDILRMTVKNPKYLEVINSCDKIFADGMPLVWLSKFRKNPLPERVAGSQIVLDFCKIASNKPYRIFLLGAAPGVADIAKEKLERQYPNIQISGTYSPDFKELKDKEASMKIVKQINSSNTNVLLVAFGAPKQENWVSEYLEYLNVNAIIPCGGTIDFIAGVQKLAPRWIGKIGLEWFYRLITNPKKMFRRYIINDLPFLASLFMQEVKLLITEEVEEEEKA